MMAKAQPYFTVKRMALFVQAIIPIGLLRSKDGIGLNDCRRERRIQNEQPFNRINELVEDRK